MLFEKVLIFPGVPMILTILLPHTREDALHERNSNSHQVILGRILDHFGSNCFSPIHKNVRCVDASMKGVPVIELDRSCCASVDYFRLSREVIHEFETESRIAGSTRQLSL